MTSEAATLLFITDPHIYADEQAMLKGINTFASLRAVLATARAHFPHPDAVILGGDLAQEEVPESYRRVRDVVGDWAGRCRAIAGNHDHPANLVRFFGDSRMPVDIGGWRIILLDSRFDGEVGGRLGTAELQHLQSQLMHSTHLPVMVVLHHHPLPIGSRWLDEIGLSDRDAFWQLIERYANVRLVAFGHAHQAFDQMRGAVRVVGTPSTCIQFRPGTDGFELDGLSPGFRWFRLRADGSFETEVERIEGFVPPDLTDNSVY